MPSEPSFVRSEVFDGITVLDGNAPTSDAVYVGFDDAFAHDGTVGSVSVVMNPESFVRSEVLDGMVVLAGNAPTSDAVYVGFVDCFAHDGTVGSVSVYPVINPESFVSCDTLVGTVILATLSVTTEVPLTFTSATPEENCSILSSSS